MSKPKPVLARTTDATAAPPTAGMERRELFVDGGRWAGWIRTDPGVEGGWHHHGDHDSYIYVTRGRLAIDYGPGGGERLTAGAGDFVFNPSHLVHREVTPPGEPVEAFVMRVGSGPQVVNVDAPEPA